MSNGDQVITVKGGNVMHKPDRTRLGAVTTVALGFALGISLINVINSLTKDIVLPIIAGGIESQPLLNDFLPHSSSTATSTFVEAGRYGDLAAASLCLIIIAAVLLLVAKPLSRQRTNCTLSAETDERPSQVKLLKEIRDLMGPDIHEAQAAIRRAEGRICEPIPGIHLDDEQMTLLWNDLSSLRSAIVLPEKKQDNFRYYCANSFFTRFDAEIYFGMIGKCRPHRIVEIGSGFSSALALDAIDFFSLETQLSCIDPNPNRLMSVLTPRDMEKIVVYSTKIQNVDLGLFQSLEAGDIVFIDSSHILRTGSDVCFELFEILPLLRTGVLIHFHDISCSFEYPHSWVIQNRRGWNEAYAIRAFLMYNAGFRIIFFNDYVVNKRKASSTSRDGKALFAAGGSLWIERN